MDAELAGKVGLSFLVGAACVSTFSITAERYGSKLSGLLSSFPATLAASLFFLALSGGSMTASQAAVPVPALMGFFAVFLTTYCALLERGLALSLFASLGIWLLLSILTLLFDFPLGASVAVAAVSLVVCYFLLEHVLKVPSMAGGKVALNWRQLLFRMFAGGSIVASAVFLGAVSGPAIGAIFAAFPAVTLGTLVVTYETGGVKLSSAFAKSLMVSSLVNSTALSLSVFLFYPCVGPYWGTAFAFLGVLGSSVGCWFIMHKIMK